MTRGGGRTLSSNKGFTLAEVLVTLGIIGVVSAMTVPSLMQNHQRKPYATQLHQVYNLLSQAFLEYTTDKNAINLQEAGLTSTEAVIEFFNKYFKLASSCSEFTDCFADSYKNQGGTELAQSSLWVSSDVCNVLANGAAVCMEHSKFHSATYGDVSVPYGHITIDINAKKGPNIAGRDLFIITYYTDGSMDEDGVPPQCKTDGKCGSGKTSAKDVRNALASACTSGTAAKGCFGLLLNSGWEMNY